MKIPKPKRLPSGMWRVQVQVEGQRLSITEPTEQACKDKAMLIKAQGRNGLYVPTLHKAKDITVRQAIDNYILLRTNVLSPSTISGYRDVQRQRFRSVMDSSVDSVKSWQAVVNNEAAIVSPKTVKNAWSVVHSALVDLGVNKEDITVTLPQIPKADRPFLEPEEITKFLEAVKGLPCEMAAILALHSLRRSEIYGLKKEDISRGIIHINGSCVRSGNDFIHKATNKSDAGSRNVPILIPRLKELVKGAAPGLLCTKNPSIIYRQINRVCKENGFREVGFHGLRHSFASLCYHLKISEMEAARLGGWDDINTMHKIYTHLAQSDKTESVSALQNFFR